MCPDLHTHTHKAKNFPINTSDRHNFVLIGGCRLQSPEGCYSYNQLLEGYYSYKGGSYTHLIVPALHNSCGEKG